MIVLLKAKMFYCLNVSMSEKCSLLEASGFEPEAFRMRNGRSTTELCPLIHFCKMKSLKRDMSFIEQASKK